MTEHDDWVNHREPPAKMKTCQCSNPQTWHDGKWKRCESDWLIVLDAPLPSPVPHSKMENDGIWAKHSEKMGMDSERIGRDLGLSVGMVKLLLGG